MINTINYQWCGETFILSPLKCIFWEKEKALILSDVHFGKTNHFRKNGIAISSEVANVDYINLELAIHQFKPIKIIVIGDLFHSHYNKEVEIFAQWKKDFNSLEWILVKGNHDILPTKIFEALELTIVENLLINNIYFTHEVTKDLMEQHPNYQFITGHIHPAVKIKLGVHWATLPCFFFNKQQLILPAFGKFTGVHILKPKKTNQVFCIANDSIIAYQKS
ncbi:MAG: ligase-associated DNA damage response endonuclease PdeM [Chitinophagaceae bacterium]